jgi:zinc protease
LKPAFLYLILKPLLTFLTGEKMRFKRYTFLLLAFCLFFITDISALERHVLDNGLEVFVEENHIVPLTTIRITFRAGAIVETEEINGLCHLYEHMLFKGNDLYKDQEEFMAALKRMGVGNWNGGTSTEYVTYYIMIPSDKLEQGLSFWAHAVMSPLLSREELIKEREVVYNEIAGKQSAPEYALFEAKLHALYPDYWYRRDTGGSLDVIKTATVEQLAFIKDNYYVPNNAAIFISGDVDPAAAVEVVKKHYGSWQKGPDFPEITPHKQLPKHKWTAVDTSPSKGLVNVSFTFRGPDAGLDTESTYSADIWGQILSDPEGKFKHNLYKAVPELHGGTRHISASYFTQRDAGETSFSFVIALSEKTDLWKTIKRLKHSLIQEIYNMSKEDYFSETELISAKKELEDHDILSRETAAGYMSNLSFWWASTSTDYYLSYLDRVKKVSVSEIQTFINSYLDNKNMLTTIWINSDDNKVHNILKKVSKIMGREDLK